MTRFKRLCAITLITLLSFQFIFNDLEAQTLVWEEDFSGISDGVTGTPDWEADCSGCGGSATFEVSSNEFLANNTDGEGTFTLATIDISSYDNIIMEVDIRKEGDFEGCYGGCGSNCFDFIALTTDIDGNTVTHVDLTNGGTCSNSVTRGYTGFIGMGDLGDPADAGTYSFTYQTDILNGGNDFTAVIGLQNWAGAEDYYIEAIRLYSVTPLGLDSVNVNEGGDVELMGDGDSKTTNPRFGRMSDGSVMISNLGKGKSYRFRVYNTVGQLLMDREFKDVFNKKIIGLKRNYLLLQLIDNEGVVTTKKIY